MANVKITALTNLASGDVADGDVFVIDDISATETKKVTIANVKAAVGVTGLTASRALETDGSGNIVVSDVTATELGYLDGVSSAVQTQIDSKIATTTSASNDFVTYARLNANLNTTTANVTAVETRRTQNIAGAISTVLTGDLATSRALASDGSGKIAASAVTATELGYLDGVSSAIQTQIDTKIATTTSASNDFVTFARLDANVNVVSANAAAVETRRTQNIAGAVSTVTTSDLTADRAVISNGSGKLAVSAVTSTEVGYLDGVSSAIQTQLDAKQATITGGATTIDTEDLTASRALVSSGSGKVAVSDVTSTELGYLDGVSSALQTQLDAKAALAGATFSGQVNMSDDLVVTGNLSVHGDTVTANAVNLVVQDQFIALSNGGTSSMDVGIFYNRGTEGNAAVWYDASDSSFYLSETKDPFSNTTVKPTSAANLNVGALTATSFTGSGAGLTAGTTPITTLDIDGATDIGEAIVDADLFIIDNGAGGTNRKVAASRLKTYTSAAAAAGDLTGSTLASGVTASSLTSVGTLTTLTVDDIIINGANIGHTSDTDAIAIASDGKVTFSQAMIVQNQVIATSLDISGDVDIDGTTNLDAVDIDGAVQADGTITVGVDDTGYDVKFFGATSGRYLLWDESADTLIFTDNAKAYFGDGNDLQIYHDGSNSYINEAGTGDLNITVNSNFTVDVVGDITLDADGGDIIFKDGGTTIGTFANNSNNLRIVSNVSDADMILRGVDGGAAIDALTLDMSEGGAATFNSAITGGGLLTTGGNIVIPDAGNIGSASDTDAIAIASDGVVTMNQIPVFSAGINVSGGNIAGTLSTAAQSNITSLGTLTTLTVDNIIINGTNIGHTSDTDAIAIASSGVVTFSQAPVFPDGSIAVADLDIDGATDIGEALVDADLIIVDNGAGGTNRKSTLSRLKTYIGSGVAADDITAGDAAVTITTTSGNITIDAQASNSDIILKGTDGGVDTTFLTLDGSDAGKATFNNEIVSGAVITSGAGLIIADAGNIGSASDTDAIAIASDGVVTFSQNIVASDDIKLQSDTSVIHFGADSEITIEHRHEYGLKITNTVSGTDGRPLELLLKSEEDDVVADDVIASILIQAGDAGGGDGHLVAAGIHAIAEGTFDSSNNPTTLKFTTGLSQGADAADTAKMTLNSAGKLTIADDLFLDSDSSVIHFGDDGEITLTHNHNAGLTLACNHTGTGGTFVIDQAGTGDPSLQIKTAATSYMIGVDNSDSDTFKIDYGTTGVGAQTGISLNTSGNVTMAADLTLGDDLFLDSDSSVIHFGNDGDVTLTHVADTGLLLNSTMQLQFNDSSQFINAPSATVLDINATDEIELNATTIDVNGNLDVSGTIIDGAGGGVVPPGTVLPYTGSSAPTGFVLCDDSAISRTTYSVLFAIIGTSYGTGNGSTTFNVPDLRDRLPLGKGTNNSSLGAITAAAGASAVVATASGSASLTKSTGTFATSAKDSSTSSALTNVTSGGHTHNLTLPAQVFNYIIKT